MINYRGYRIKKMNKLDKWVATPTNKKVKPQVAFCSDDYKMVKNKIDEAIYNYLNPEI